MHLFRKIIKSSFFLFHANPRIVLIVLLLFNNLFQLSTSRSNHNPLICPDHLLDGARGKTVQLCVDSREKLRLGALTPKRAVSVKPTFNWRCLKKGCRCYSIRYKKQLPFKKKLSSSKCFQISLPPLYKACPTICPTCQCLQEQVNYRLQF